MPLQSVVWLKSIFVELLARGEAEKWPSVSRDWKLELFLDYPYGSPELARPSSWQHDWVEHNGYDGRTAPHRPSWIAWPAKAVTVLANRSREVDTEKTALDKHRAKLVYAFHSNEGFNAAFIVHRVWTRA